MCMCVDAIAALEIELFQTLKTLMQQGSPSSLLVLAPMPPAAGNVVRLHLTQTIIDVVWFMCMVMWCDVVQTGAHVEVLNELTALELPIALVHSTTNVIVTAL